MWYMRIGCSFRLGILCDKKKGGMLLALKLGSIFEDLQRMVVENFCFEKTDADLELSYLPIGLINTAGCQPVIIGNNRQVTNFLGLLRKISQVDCVLPIINNSFTFDNLEQILLYIIVECLVVLV